MGGGGGEISSPFVKSAIYFSNIRISMLLCLNIWFSLFRCAVHMSLVSRKKVCLGKICVWPLQKDILHNFHSVEEKKCWLSLSLTYGAFI